VGFVLAVAAAMALALSWASPAFAAYAHHGEIDSGIFLGVHGEVKGTKLDSCSLCHSGGKVLQKGSWVDIGTCQWCHTTGVYGYDSSGDILKTLNPYGKAFLGAGRSAAAVKAIEGLDSDADGYSNADEIAALRFPGDPADDPTKVEAPYRVYTMAELKAMPAHTQFLLMNASQSNDDYTSYTGVPVTELLSRAGMRASATGIRVYAPDGWMNYHPLDGAAPLALNIYPVRFSYPQATYYYDAVADLAKNPKGWVNYSSPGNVGRTDGSPIVVPGGLRMILAYARDGAPLVPGVLDKSNKLNGEGPLRLVPPQAVLSVPDQSSKNTSSTLIWPYDTNLDHNAGSSSRSVTIIKVEPLLPGTTDINILEAGWEYVDTGKVVVYGAIDPLPTARVKVHALAHLVDATAKAKFRGKAVVRRALARKLRAVETQIKARHTSNALHIIEKDILPKIDGVPRRNSKHRWDWMYQSEARRRVYWGVKEVRTLLRAAR
jgi:hypothetical protein